MDKLNEFIKLLSGKFDNSDQLKQLEKEGIHSYPYAKHINTVCNDKINDLPEDFKGIFLLEESYYTVNKHTNAMPHLFLFTEEGDKIKLTSYEMPEGYTKENFCYENITSIQYNSLKVSEKFTPALYEEKEGVWEGGSISMFSPSLKFTLHERFSEKVLEVSENMESNDKRIFGYDKPLVYKRIS